jgi:DNA-binding transcriptional LysR family regulator
VNRKLRRLHSSSFVYFMAVAAEGSFRGGARKLNTASSAVNRHILLLERELGLSLFDRHNRSLTLSRAGEIVLAHCKGTVRSFDDALEALDALKDLHSGIVRVAASESFAVEIVPAICSRFSGEYPKVSVQVEVAGSDAVLDMIEKDVCDVGFAFGQINSSKLRIVSKADLEIGAIVGAGHPLFRRKTISVRECLSHPIVIPKTGLSFRDRLEKVTRHFSDAEQGGVVASSPRLMMAIARMGKHVAFQTRIGIADDVARGVLAFIPLNDKGLKPDRCAIVASKLAVGRFAAERFCEFAKVAMAGLSGAKGERGPASSKTLGVSACR